MQGETDGSGFKELGMIYCGSVAADPEMTDPDASVYLHRGYCYVLSQKVTYEEKRFSKHRNVSQEEVFRLKRFRLDNLNISEELFYETMNEAWETVWTRMIFDRDDAYLEIFFEKDADEGHMMEVAGAMRLYRFRDGGDREELFSGDLPVSLNDTRAVDGKVEILGRYYADDRIVLLSLDEEKKSFREQVIYETFAETDDYWLNRASFGDGYVMTYKRGIGAVGWEDPENDENCIFRFYSESGSPLGEKILNYGKTMEDLHLEYDQYNSFWINYFLRDRDMFYGSLTVEGFNGKYWNIIRIPVDDSEDWSLLFSDSE